MLPIPSNVNTTMNTPVIGRATHRVAPTFHVGCRFRVRRAGEPMGRPYGSRMVWISRWEGGIKFTELSALSCVASVVKTEWASQGSPLRISRWDGGRLTESPLLVTDGDNALKRSKCAPSVFALCVKDSAGNPQVAPTQSPLCPSCLCDLRGEKNSVPSVPLW